jgi:DnaJ-class molecular chaperone
LIVVIQVSVPTRLDQEQKELFRKLGTTMNGEVIPSEKEKGIFDHLRDLREALGF